MLGYLIPDGLQRLFVSLAVKGPLPLQGLLFAFLCVAFVLVLTLAARRALLQVDASAALRSRRAGQEPNSAIHATGWVAQGQWYILAILCGFFAVSTFAFEVGRRGSLAGTALEPVFNAARAVHVCLRPSSGNQPDTLRQCGFD